MSTDLPTLTKRRLQAQVIGPIFAEMVAQIGEEKAAEILDAAIRKAAIAEGKEFASKSPGGKRPRRFTRKPAIRMIRSTTRARQRLRRCGDWSSRSALNTCGAETARFRIFLLKNWLF